MFGINLKKAFGYGFAIYLVSFVYWALVVAFGQGDASWSMYGALVVILLSARVAGMKTGETKALPLLKYGVIFALIMIVLDVILSNSLSSGMFSMWETYVTYVGVVLFAVSAVWCPMRNKKQGGK